jgi:hypothetical protein
MRARASHFFWIFEIAGPTRSISLRICQVRLREGGREGARGRIRERGRAGTESGREGAAGGYIDEDSIDAMRGGLTLACVDVSTLAMRSHSLASTSALPRPLAVRPSPGFARDAKRGNPRKGSKSNKGKISTGGVRIVLKSRMRSKKEE